VKIANFTFSRLWAKIAMVDLITIKENQKTVGSGLGILLNKAQ